MDCDVCHRRASDRLAFYCVRCAQGLLYKPRLAIAQTLLHTEKLQNEVEDSVLGVKGPATVQKKTSDANLHPTWKLQQLLSQETATKESTSSELEHVQALRDEIRHMRLQIAERKARLSQRRSDLNCARQDLKSHQIQDRDTVLSESKQKRRSLEDIHRLAAVQRLTHCMQVTRLYSLQQRRRRDADVHELYSVGLIPITDLRDLNNANPAQLTPSLTQLANLVHQIAHHLTLKLPAQILLPTSDYPHCTILSPTSSYTANHLIFPGSTPSHSMHNITSAARQVERRHTQVRPRPLFCKKKLSVLAKDDALTYAHVVEGITLLAWDIAWLCKTQGLSIGDSNWEDICSMGRNLVQLISAFSKQLQRPAGPVLASAGDDHEQQSHETPRPTPGFFAHSCAPVPLASAQGYEYLREWKLLSHIKVIDKVKAMLLADRTGAEWELVDTHEWADWTPNDHEANHVGNEPVNPNIKKAATSSAPVDSAATAASSTPSRIDETAILVPTERNNSSSASKANANANANGTGWTKLRPRPPVS